MNNQDRLIQIQSLAQKVYEDAMGLDVDSNLGKDSGATQLSSLINAFLKLEAREAQIKQELSGLTQTRVAPLQSIPA